MTIDDTDLRLLDDFQRDLPLVPRPFAVMGVTLGIPEAGVIARLEALRGAGRIA
ncbi:MAG: Lrp/AsnC family transcriptional regulator, partial [Paracoccus sp. (in: a-proteobacteria)]